MTKKDRDLLLKDLCARLPYGVIVDYKENEFELPHWKITTIYPETLDGWIGYDKRVGAGSESGSRPFKIGEVKPYLRPMSSMTKEEGKELEHIFSEIDAPCWVDTEYGCVTFAGGDFIDAGIAEVYTDWLNKKMFDYRGLIEKGLALEAPEDMYKNE